MDNRLSCAAKMIANIATVSKTRSNKTGDFAVIQKVGSIDVMQEGCKSYPIREREAST